MNENPYESPVAPLLKVRPARSRWWLWLWLACGAIVGAGGAYWLIGTDFRP